MDMFSPDLGDVIKFAQESQHEFVNIRDAAAKVAEHQDRALAHSQSTNEALSNVIESVGKTLRSIQTIEQNVNETVELSGSGGRRAQSATEFINQLSETAEKIGSVVTLIQDIASQANLLSLNATIEAARAGDAGRGFAVVAKEMKNLANQTANATGEITNQIDEIQSLTRSSSQAFFGVVEEINKSASSIKLSVEDQRQSMEDISQKTEDISRMAEITVHNIKQSQANASQNRDRAARLLVANETLIDKLQNLNVLATE